MGIDGTKFAKCALAAANLLGENEKTINNLNVYPVPDGDTGSNMRGTMADALLSPEFCLRDIGACSEEFGKRMLKSARGNSGAILSQFFLGFSLGLRNLGSAEISHLANAFSLGTQYAYSAVSRPAEGTILTVMAAVSKKAAEISSQKSADLQNFMDEICASALTSLSATTEMLPKLREAGVVDAGGLGFLTILLGFRDEICGLENEEIQEGFLSGYREADFSALKTEDIRYTFCVEFVLKKNPDLLGEGTCSELSKLLSPLGDSMVFIDTDSVVKLHIHTNSPETVFETAENFGVLENRKVENMACQHTNLISPGTNSPSPVSTEKEFGFVFVSVGDGFDGIFRDLGADKTVFGGQSMNPSVGDFLEAVSQTPAKNVFLFPGNKNIVLSANQAASLITEQNVLVIPTTSLPQSVSAALCFDPELSPEENAGIMTSAAENISTISVTKAVKSAVVSGRKVERGEYIGLLDGDLRSVGSCAEECIRAFEPEFADAEFINIYYGRDVSEKSAKETAETIEALSLDGETELMSGGQPLYDYLISLE